MKRILNVVKESGFTCLPSDQVNLDVDRLTEYQDSGEHPADLVFERPTPSDRRKKVVRFGNDIPSIFRYFLDGSRRTYKVADIILNGRYLPLVAGQVGVAVVKRDSRDNSLGPMRQYCRFQSVIAFPESTNDDDLTYLEKRIREECGLDFLLLKYSVKADRDPIDLAVAQIMKKMQDLEIQVVGEMFSENYLGNDSMLIIDGPLRFKQMKGRSLDIIQFRNVVGLSKTFRPHFTFGKGSRRKDVGSITCGLAFGERTVVFKPTEQDSIGTIGMWYLRLRSTRFMSNPLQGIVKMECFAIEPEDKENGLDCERIDVISGHILRERNVTPFGVDSRWASHIYPIFLAEAYLRASFMSDTKFR